MAVLGVDNKITRRVCDPEVLERAKVEGMLHWAQAAGKDTGKSRNCSDDCAKNKMRNNFFPSNIASHTIQVS